MPIAKVTVRSSSMLRTSLIQLLAKRRMSREFGLKEYPDNRSLEGSEIRGPNRHLCYRA